MTVIRPTLVLAAAAAALSPLYGPFQPPPGGWRAHAAQEREGERVTAAPSGDSLVVTAAWLSARLEDPRVVVLHVSHEDSYGQGHVPGARALAYDRIVTRQGELGSELPPLARLRDTFERLGVADSTHVVVYGDHAPMATRAIFTLAYMGHERVSLLDGGLAGWKAAGHPVTRARPRVERGRLTARQTAPVVADAPWVEARLGRSGVALVDTRSDGEYVGAGERHGMPSEGHLAGARQLEWEELFVDGGTTLRPRDELRATFAERAAPGDTVVTYCWVGYRASATWFAARLLGYEARMYDGSYQDWSQRRLPVRAGADP